MFRKNKKKPPPCRHMKMLRCGRVPPGWSPGDDLSIVHSTGTVSWGGSLTADPQLGSAPYFAWQPDPPPGVPALRPSRFLRVIQSGESKLKDRAVRLDVHSTMTFPLPDKSVATALAPAGIRHGDEVTVLPFDKGDLVHWRSSDDTVPEGTVGQVASYDAQIGMPIVCFPGGSWPFDMLCLATTSPTDEQARTADSAGNHVIESSQADDEVVPSGGFASPPVGIGILSQPNESPPGDFSPPSTDDEFSPPSAVDLPPPRVFCEFSPQFEIAAPSGGAEEVLVRCVCYRLPKPKLVFKTCFFLTCGYTHQHHNRAGL